jgi:AcrR family transcriptional regulator
MGVDSSDINMNVNKPNRKRRSSSAVADKRARRSPETARAEILAAARDRLLRYGIDGLKITDVARDASMSHATLLHHFGSSDGMRSALVEHMANALLAEFIELIGDGAPTPARLGELFSRLFSGLSETRHAQLFAWFALTALDRPDERESAATETRPMIAALLEQMGRHRPTSSRAPQPRYVVLMVIAAAIGLGVARPWLEQVDLLKTDADVGEFAQWFAEFLLAQRASGE